MKTRIFRNTLLSILTVMFSACGGGGGGSDGPTADTNACNVLGLQTRIINGTQCSGTSPVVRVVIVQGNEYAACTGTLIARNKVLTATHCVTDDTFSVPVSASSVSIYGESDSQFLAKTTRVIYNPQASQDLEAIAVAAEAKGDDPSSPKFDITSYIHDIGLSDVAVIVLDRNLSLPRAQVRIGSVPPDNSIISIFGYGILTPSGTTPSTALYSGEMSVAYSGVKNFFSLYDGDASDTCNGDSGGPAFAQEADGSYSVVGTTLGGTKDCAPGDLAIFTSMAGGGIPAFLRSAAPDATFR